ncbi:hypothetical protein LAZ67_3002593 [Cordylochernes scorpioides]|uniref:RNA-directed DNA polymerase n=1 Tax=Cordylochernes scorpioides TaxID=51811 RepID=A0ABY6K875_9ARAC|nr:hypothetical protein LAZ67_3002593 [Cordylochernes scorpioides]
MGSKKGSRVKSRTKNAFLSSDQLPFIFKTPSRVLVIPHCMLHLPLKRLRFQQSTPFSSNNKQFRNDIATDGLSRQDKEMEINQDSIGVKKDDPTKEREEEGSRQEMTGREETGPLADVIQQFTAALSQGRSCDPTGPTISPFDGTYSAIQVFQVFDRKMEDAAIEEKEKLLRLPNYLVRQPLELFRKLRLADRSYFQVRQILLDLYPESSEASFAKYFAMKLTGQANLETYYREKTAMGLQLGLPQEESGSDWYSGSTGPVYRQRDTERTNRPRCRVRTTTHLDAQVPGMHLFHRPTVSSAARDTGTANAGIDQSRRPTKKTGQCNQSRATDIKVPEQCNQSQSNQSRVPSNQVKPETPQQSRLFETEQRSYNLTSRNAIFLSSFIDFLGYTVTAGTTTPLTRNTDIIHAIKQPHNRKTLQSFLGAVNVYNKFIPEYARLRAPLNNLLKKDVVWIWDEACQKAFIDLKGNLTQHPILHLYKEGLPCQVYCDASTLGIAGILKQVHPDGNVYPVQFFSRTLRPHEKNYSISELECLAIVESVEKFRNYLMGRKFTIFSDHHALQWLKTIKNPSGRLFRWSLRLSSYEYEVRYIKGKQQYEADLSSRNPFCGFLDASLIKTHQPPPSRESSLTIDRIGLHTVSRKGVTKIIIPKPLIQQLLQTVHTQYNHPGISQMSRLISSQYFWQGMSKDIKQKVKTCPTCQLTKRPLGPTYGELSQPPEAKEPFDLLFLDIIAGFAKYGNTKIYLHVVVDHFSRYAWIFPSKSTSITTYQQVLKRVLQDGSPKRLLTDRAPAFTLPKFSSFLLNRNIHPLLTTNNNPQANGLCERLNATLTGKLRLLHLENPKIAWTKLVKRVTVIYNKTPHSTTGFPPIYLMFGIVPPELSDHSTPYPDIDKARKIAHTRTQNKHLQDKNIYDQRHKQPHFEVGDLVLVKSYHHPNTGKLAPYFTGPHTVLEIISPNVVRIDRPNQPLQRDTDTIHVNKLKLYTETVRYISPPAVRICHIKHKPDYTFPFKHFTPELFPAEPLRVKPTNSEPFRHLDPAIFSTRRFAPFFPDVKNCEPDNHFNPIILSQKRYTPLPNDNKQCEIERSTMNKRKFAFVVAKITKESIYFLLNGALSLSLSDVSDGGVGLLDIAGQLRLACLKGVQASLRGAANGYSWLVRSRAWLTPPAPDVWHSPRRRRLLSLWEAASSVLELDHRVLHPACLRSLRLRGDNRFLRPPDLLAPERWLQATVGDFSDGAPALARSTRAALLDAQHLGAFCQRLLRENASSSYHAEYEADTIVLRGSATPITRLPSQRARRALDSARLQAHPTAELAARWTPTVDVPRSIPWADLRRNCFSGHDADVALRLALHALPHPDHPASRRANCAACGSSDGSLAHRYWSCQAVRTLLREVFASCDLPLDLQAWLFGVGLHPEAVKLTSVAKATIYKYHLGLELDEGSSFEDFEKELESFGISQNTNSYKVRQIVGSPEPEMIQEFVIQSVENPNLTED